MRRALAIAFVAAALAPAADGAQPTGFAFGRTGGNIRPFTVTIDTDGHVRVSGPVNVGRTKLTLVQLGTLNRIAADARFTTLAKVTNCPGTLPDIAATFVRVGAHTVRVHGGCVSRYTDVWKALVRAVKLSSS